MTMINLLSDAGAEPGPEEEIGSEEAENPQRRGPKWFTREERVLRRLRIKLKREGLNKENVARVYRAMSAWSQASDWVYRLEHFPEYYPSAPRSEWTRLWKKRQYSSKLELTSVGYDLGLNIKDLIERTQSELSEMRRKMYVKENPEGGESWFSTGGMRNWLILAAIGVGGYFVWRKWIKPKFAKKAEGPLPALPVQTKVTPMPSPPYPGWTFVKANQVSSTTSNSYIKKRQKNMLYAKILITRTDRGYPVREFVPTANGWFTGNLVNEGVATWAEIKPA